MDDLIGRWRVENGPRAGLVYHFRPDGSFQVVKGTEDVHAAGRYCVRADATPYEIDIHFVQHATPEELGLVRGIFDLESDRLRMKLSPPDSDYWIEQAQLTFARA
jgi:hypothetical protein